MGLDEDAIISLDEQILSFSGERVDTRGYVDLHTKFGRTDRGHKTILVRYLIVDVYLSHNVYLMGVLVQYKRNFGTLPSYTY